MPEQVHDCVQSVLDDNPDMDESRAWAICHAQTEAETDDVTAIALDEIDVDAESLDALAQETATWEREASDGVVAWIDTDDGAVVYDEITQQADGFGVDVYRIVQTEAEGPAEEGALLGVAVDMPNAGVYVDWNIDAWPDDEQLTGAHVSDYDNLDDLAQVTAGELEQVQSVTAEQQADDGHVLGPATNGVSYRLEDSEVYCEAEGEVFDRSEASRGICPHCGESFGPDQQAVTISGLSQEALTAIDRRYNVTIEEVNDE